MSRKRFALLHLSSVFLLSLMVLFVSLTWAQRTLPAKATSIQLARYAVPVAAVSEAQTRLFFFHEEMALRVTPSFGQTGSGRRLISRGAGYHPLLPTNKSVVELGAKANYLIGNAPTPWLANVPDNVHHRTAYARDIQYYGRRIPLVGETILRIARQADSHPRTTRVLRLIINPRF
jgi:hypothetical protein